MFLNVLFQCQINTSLIRFNLTSRVHKRSDYMLFGVHSNRTGRALFVKTMWRIPGLNEESLKRFGCLDDIYDAMRSGDLAEVVYTALDVIKRTGSVPFMTSEKKSDATSTDFRRLGNQAYLKKEYHEALMLYNKALKFAPEKSLALKLGFSNRSALFMTVKAYSACIHDIDTCFNMGCPAEIESKLKQRQREAFDGLRAEDDWLPVPKFANGYFKLLHEPRNPQISSATMDVGVIMEDNCPKIVAAKDVKVGTVVAVDQAFVTDTEVQNIDISCYNCHKLHYNLIPCEGCCYVMFCDEECMKNCMSQYHSVECKIIGLFEATECKLECSEKVRLAVKAAIKMKLRSSWKKLIEDSKVYGMDRIKKSSISQIYDIRENSCMLTYKENRHFIYGSMYNAGFTIAAVLYYMSKTNFLPYDYGARQEAIKGLARIMMYLALFGTPTVILDSVSINNTGTIDFHGMNNFGLFPLVGKLRHTCQPNTLALGLGDRIALVALENITRGTEITISYLDHWLDKGTDDTLIRNRNLYVLWGYACTCVVCCNDTQLADNTLTPAQRAAYDKLNFGAIDVSKLPSTYKGFCRVLAVLRDVPFSEEYKSVYRYLRTCLLHLQHVYTENVVLQRVRVRKYVY